MYEELVERLRTCGNSLSCNKCKWSPDCGGTGEVLRKAADTIEGLSGLVDHYGGETGLKNLEEYANKYFDLLKNAPRWIPVKELLPEESEGLNWGEEPTLRFTSVWCCDVNTGTIGIRNRLQGKKTWIDGLDQYMKDTDWHWSQSWWEPTHWMPIVPLPEKPKE